MTITTPKVECEQLHAGLAVSDVIAAVDFYTTKLGFWLASPGVIRRRWRA